MSIAPPASGEAGAARPALERGGGQFRQEFCLPGAARPGRLGAEEIERRLGSVEEHAPGTWRTAAEGFADIGQRLEERRATRTDSPTPPRTPRLTGRARDVAGAA